MMRIPFALQRPWLLIQSSRTDRDRPDLAQLGAIEDPDRFVWAILPHAARSFATSILMLPSRQALTAAVAYLYCRMLDSYEDVTGPADREAALSAFAARMRTLEPPPAVKPTPQDDRDRAHLLLIDRCALIDTVLASLDDVDRERIIGLVEAMADGMIWASQRFAEQGGVLIDAEQVRRYCHYVMGEPALFTLLLLGGTDLTGNQHRDALASSELIQIANITRDIEKDLVRGAGYHPVLLPHLGRLDAVDPVRRARRHLMAQALPQVSAYIRLAGQLPTRRFSPARASAVLMLLRTDRHYSWCAQKVGMSGWRGPGTTTAIVLSSLPAALSRRWATRMMLRVERDLLGSASDL